MDIVGILETVVVSFMSCKLFSTLHQDGSLEGQWISHTMYFLIELGGSIHLSLVN